MKKILITRKLLKLNEEKASKIFDVKLNSNDELYSQTKLIELSNGCDGILTSITDKIDEETINKLPNTVKIISNFAVGFGNIDLGTAKKRSIAVTNTPDVLTDARNHGKKIKFADAFDEIYFDGNPAGITTVTFAIDG